MSEVKVSHAYEVLLSMEYYGKSKKGANKVFHRKKNDKDDKRPRSPNLEDQFHLAVRDAFAADSMNGLSTNSFGSTLSATSLVEQNWKKDHRKGLAKLMDDLHISRRSFDGKRPE